jgi:monoamine oxidase
MRGSLIVRRALEQARRRQRALSGLAPPLSGTSGIGRRALLKSMAAAAGLAALPLAACRKPAGGSGEVAIVGGGIAGLAALRTLTAAGVPARLYEARQRIGGRIHTRTDFPLTGWVEMGGQLVNSDHADMIALAEAFSIPLLDTRALGGVDQAVLDRRLLAESALAEALGPIATQIAEDSERLDADWEAAAPDLDRESAAAYLDRHGNLLADVSARRLLEQTVRTEYGAEPDEASALQLIFNLPTVDGEAYEALGTSDERYIVTGGSQRITDALAGAHADRIERGRRLTALVPTDGGGVTLRFAGGEDVTADRVIVAVPPALLGEIYHGGLLSADWQAFASEVRLGSNEKLNAVYGSKPWTETAMGIDGATWDLSENAAFAEVWECTGGQKAPQGVLSWYFGGRQVEGQRDENVRAALEAAVGSAMGDLAGAAQTYAARTAWGADPFTRGAYVNFKPGQLTKFGGLLWVEEDDGTASQVARSGPILFAGEHLSDAWPGFMNGAAQTGRLAAQAIIAEA